MLSLRLLRVLHSFLFRKDYTQSTKYSRIHVYDPVLRHQLQHLQRGIPLHVANSNEFRMKFSNVLPLPSPSEAIVANHA